MRFLAKGLCVLRIYNGLKSYKPIGEYKVVTIGNFDGVHLGHQSVLLRLVKDANKQNGDSILVTFEPHPVEILNKNIKISLLQNKNQFEHAIQENKISDLIVEAFTHDYSQMSADQFFDQIYSKIKFNKLYIGYDFKFGKDKSGDYGFLLKKSNELGFALEQITPFKIGNEVVSSSLIREKIENGEIKKANFLLGRPYEVEGNVVKGQGKGAKIGFPTLNIAPYNDVFLKKGVYETEVCVSGIKYKSITNFGLAPTIKSEVKPVLETHIINNSLEAYNKKVSLKFLSFLRPEQKFASVSELIEQIKIDIDTIMNKEE